MNCTEEEAKTKWCPHSQDKPIQLSTLPPGMYSHVEIEQHRGYCIASECMAWEWTKHKNQKGYCGI